MNEQAIGEILAKARKEKKLKLKKAATDLRIKQEYLEAIEEGRLSYVSPHIYPTGYIKSYAGWLGLNHEEISALIKDGRRVDANVEELPTHEKKPITKAGSAITNPHKIGFGTLFSFMTPSGFTPSRQKAPDIKLLRVNGRTLLTALVFAGLTYVVWQYLDSNTPELLPDNVAKQEEAAAQEAKETGYLSNGSQKLVMFASEETLLYLYYPDTKTREQHLLSVGEAYFLPEGKEIIIDADKAAAVEVFAGPDGSEFLGTLAEMMAKDVE